MPTVTRNHGEPALADVQAQYPAWQCAQAVSGMYYACHPATGRQVTGEDPRDLRDQIKAANARHAATPPGGPGPLYQPGQL